MSKIFISHSSKDSVVVNEFVKLLEFLGLTSDHIFCSSIEGYGVPLDRNIYDHLRDELDESNLYVIFILSENYYNSPACLNEMGAAWVKKHEYGSILLDNFKYAAIDGAIDAQKSAFKINEPYKLTEFKNKLVTLFKLIGINDSTWERRRDEFIEKINPSNESAKKTPEIKKFPNVYSGRRKM